MVDLMTTALKEAYARASDVIVLSTLEFRVPTNSGSTVLRLVRDYGTLLEVGDPDIYGHMLTLEPDAPLNAGESVRFIACMFDFELPEQKDGPLPSINIAFDNAARLLAPEFDALVELGLPIEVTYREYRADDTTAPAFQFGGMVLNSVKSSVARVEGVAEFVNLVNDNFPGVYYQPEHFPGLVRQ